MRFPLSFSTHRAMTGRLCKSLVQSDLGPWPLVSNSLWARLGVEPKQGILTKGEDMGIAWVLPGDGARYGDSIGISRYHGDITSNILPANGT